MSRGALPSAAALLAGAVLGYLATAALLPPPGEPGAERTRPGPGRGAEGRAPSGARMEEPRSGPALARDAAPGNDPRPDAPAAAFTRAPPAPAAAEGASDAPPADVVVTVLGPEGEPVLVEHFGIELRGREHRSGSGRATRRPDGAYGLALSEPERRLFEEPGVTLVVGAVAAGYGVRDVTLAPGAREATIRFDRPALLDLRLDGYAGTDLEGAVLLQLERIPGRGEDLSAARRTLSATPDSDGRGRFGPVEPASWRASAFLAGGTAPWLHPVIAIASSELNLGEGRSEVRLAIPALSSFVVIVEGAEDRIDRGTLRLTPAGERGGYLHLPVGPSGKVAFERVPPGEFKLELSTLSGRFEPMRLTIPCPPEVRFSASKQDPPPGDPAPR